MAYVAISGQLLERVCDKINSMHRAEYKTIGELTFSLSNGSSALDQALWGEHLSLKSQMPEKWLKKIDIVEVHFKVLDKAQSYHVRLTGDYFAPPIFNSYSSTQIDIDHPDFAVLKDWHIKKTEIANRWADVMSKVKGFLEKCKSLNEAVKLWPDVTMYLDPSDIERMGVKRETKRESEALAALKSLDTDALVGAAVIARLSGATV